ncbi:unnamed protein product [Brachionus calyciflorus]|uniref:RanBD1 domain-containing protein n=1 Tax=Brachionus calyciflorus TaxID=104777 RepID=A0A813MCR7_9BILA|nr:unnamed protein product [Brachionus calyciflorus]
MNRLENWSFSNSTIVHSSDSFDFSTTHHPTETLIDQLKRLNEENLKNQEIINQLKVQVSNLEIEKSILETKNLELESKLKKYECNVQSDPRIYYNLAKIDESDNTIIQDSCDAPVEVRMCTIPNSSLLSSTKLNLNISHNDKMVNSICKFKDNVSSFIADDLKDTTLIEQDQPCVEVSTYNDSENSNPHNFEPILNVRNNIVLPVLKIKSDEDDYYVYFNDKCFLYSFVSEDNCYKEKGLGDLKILKNKMTKVVQILMRRSGLKTLILQNRLQGDINLIKCKDRHMMYQWACINTAEVKEGAIENVVAKFMSKKRADNFRKIFELSVYEIKVMNGFQEISKSKKNFYNKNEDFCVYCWKLIPSNSETLHRKHCESCKLKNFYEKFNDNSHDMEGDINMEECSSCSKPFDMFKYDENKMEHIQVCQFFKEKLDFFIGLDEDEKRDSKKCIFCEKNLLPKQLIKHYKCCDILIEMTFFIGQNYNIKIDAEI